MARFLYNIPGVSGVSSDTLRRVGRGYLLDGAEPTISRVEVQRGPGDAAGVICAIGESSPDLGYFPERQTWQPAPDEPSWMGWQTDALPGPDDLQRPEPVGLYRATLGDGRPWVIPTGVLASGESPLPRVRTMEPDGSIRRVVAAPFRELYLASDLVLSHLRSGEPIPEAEEWRICVLALSANYRVGPQEISVLGLLTDRAVATIYSCLCDVPRWPSREA
ncbi:MAG: hypothetical protein BWX86_00540 [Verrucomicrobia bacterium ADurb.Bin122]|nr:MAG: hypothetical protein BWX86_00540 [Verrucomicrobia bacterium ADurb.Bin122]